MKTALIRPEELHEVLDFARVLDASYGQQPPDKGIPGAVDFDIDAVADPAAALPHTIPSSAVFAEKAGALGIGNDDLVVVYDRSGIHMAAARAWWMFRLFGHENVKILDGGLNAWVKAGYPLTPKNARPAPKEFIAEFRAELLKRLPQVKDNILKQDFTVLDARDAARYAGDAPEPRPGMGRGHIPGSLSVPFAELIGADGKLRPRAELESMLSRIDRKKPLACSCGSGVTACVVALGLFETGTPDAAVYDGSWAEWGGDPALPKTAGSAP
jgi:thiosulfate/3-mercaptopyruvate sulfurtransferase